MTEQIDLGLTFRGKKDGNKIHAVQAGKRELKATDVVVSIVASGLCFTDVHFISHGSCSLGHEGAGFVSKVGADVKDFKNGDRVGWGYIHGADLTCDACIAGVDTLCPNAKMFGLSNKEQGSIGDRYVIDSRFLHKIPDSLSLAHAAPLQCAGATVFGAIYNAGVRPYDRVGVVGLGGLGSLAIQYLNKCGCEVVVFSGTESKKEDALKLGAHEFVAVKEGGFKKLSAPVKFLFVATSAQPKWDDYLSPRVLAARGTIVPLSVSTEPLHLRRYQTVVGRELKIQGSVVASRGIHREMLRFSARHQINPIIETLPMTEAGVQEGVDRLIKGDVRYRFVFLHPTNKDPRDAQQKARM